MLNMMCLPSAKTNNKLQWEKSDPKSITPLIPFNILEHRI